MRRGGKGSERRGRERERDEEEKEALVYYKRRNEVKRDDKFE